MGLEVAIAASIVSGAVGVASQYQAQRAQATNARYNADLARNQAEQSRMEAEENFRRRGKNKEQQLARVRARLANQGSVATVGTPLAVLGDHASELELEIMDAYNSAESKRQGLVQQSAQFREQSKSIRRGSKFSLMGGLADLGSQTYFNNKYRQKIGMFD